ncbi:hypothetical protein KIN20_004080 [Parelaphostrongylus tenuis]|uniref:Uncharacterized protein n=1 Tax=Parelaphostrongylus tenuis TaxID=148309 RepID=A0AAD5QGM9_PARTN|nr:hypothetical protein KIN20_004080 [Parelaphostrongylus tenuis]
MELLIVLRKGKELLSYARIQNSPLRIDSQERSGDSLSCTVTTAINGDEVHANAKRRRTASQLEERVTNTVETTGGNHYTPISTLYNIAMSKEFERKYALI